MPAGDRIGQSEGDREAADGDGVAFPWRLLKTLGGGLQGEFNEDPKFAEIGVDLGVSLIPVLDQVSDVRDLSAHVYYMTSRPGELSSSMRWVGLAFTLIGLFPEIGSAIKGVSKVLIRGGRQAIQRVHDMMRSFGLVAASLDELVAFLRRNWPPVARYGRELWFAKLAEVRQLLDLAPGLFRSRLQPLIDRVDLIRRLSGSKLDEAFRAIDGLVSRALESLGIRLDGPLLATANGAPGVAVSMSNHGETIAKGMKHPGGGGSLPARRPTAASATKKERNPAGSTARPAKPFKGVTVGALDELKRPTHVLGEVKPSDLHTGSATGKTYPVGLEPGELSTPAWRKNLPDKEAVQPRYRAQRGHLLAALFGGQGTDPRNLVWMHEKINLSRFKVEFEHPFRAALKRNESVAFSIQCLYRSREAAPYALEVWARSSSGAIIVPHKSILTPGLSDIDIP